MTDVKAAEDLNFRPLAIAPTTQTLLHAPHKQQNLTFRKLIVPSIGYRQAQLESTKPVGTAKVVQEVGQFCSKILENRMFCDIGRVLFSRIRRPNRFAQGSEAIDIAMIITTMQTMSHPVRRLSPPPDIALEGISQTTLGLPAPQAVKAQGSNQHRSIPLAPRRSCKNRSIVRKFANRSTSEKVCQLHMCT